MWALPIMWSRGRCRSTLTSPSVVAVSLPEVSPLTHGYDLPMSTNEPRWRRRYRAPSLTLPNWAADNPERLVYACNASGSWQVHAWDRATGEHRQVTAHPTGVVAGGPTPDGEGIVWFDDSKGDEIGQWLLQPFHGGDDLPLMPGVEPAWSAGIALGPDRRVAVGMASRVGFSVQVGRAGEPGAELYRHEQSIDVADMSRDGRVLVVHHAEHGDNLHPALRAFDLERGVALADLWDGRGYGRFRPAAGPHLPGPRRAVPAGAARWLAAAAGPPGGLHRRRQDPA